MKRYPVYKNSGVDWIDEIPLDWNISKLKWLAKVRLSNIDKKTNEGEQPVNLCNYVDVYYNEKITLDLDFMRATAPLEKIDNFTLQGGDVLITKDSETPDDIAVPAYVPLPLPGVVCGYHLALIRSNNGANGNYLFRSFVAYGIRDQFEIAANGITRFGIGKYVIDNSIFLAPTIDEQLKIAKYLDHKTHLIDTLIEKKQKQIKLLQEQRAAIINQAVTKGLNPNVKMKDSGIEWLGEVPEHWDVTRLKWLLEGKLKYGANESAELDDDSLPRYIRITDFSDDGTLREETFKSLPEDKAFEYLLNEGDILFARSGATVGKTFQFKNYTGMACYAGYLIKATPDDNKMASDFLYYYTKSNAYENWKNSIFIQATIQNIGADKYQNLPIPVPPLNEQALIIEYISMEAEKIQKHIAFIQKSIELLSEFRTTLISEIVTGKIDVRDEVIP